MKYCQFFCLLTLFVVPTQVRAEFICTSEISYSWKKEEAELKVFHSSVKHLSTDEETGKRTIAAPLLTAESKAQRTCQSEHENLSGCLASKLNATTTARSIGSFSARKEIEKAIDADCKMSNGQCRGTSHTDVVCKEVVAPAEEGAGKSDEKAKGKEKAKKK